MSLPRFKLSASNNAILSDSIQRTMITIPANTLITPEDGDAEGNGFVRIHFAFHDKSLPVEVKE